MPGYSLVDVKEKQINKYAYNKKKRRLLLVRVQLLEQLSSRAPRTAQESRANFFMVGAAVGGFMTATMTGEPTDIRRFSCSFDFGSMPTPPLNKTPSGTPSKVDAM